MTIVKAANRLVLSILLAAATCAANAEQIADGIAWTKSSEDMHVAYIRAIWMCCPQAINTMRNISLGSKIFQP